VLGTGSVVAYERETAPPRPRLLAPVPSVAGVAAAVEVGPAAGRSRFVEPLVVTVVLQAGPAAGRLELLAVEARGFALRVAGGTPRALGDPDRRRRGMLTEVVRLLVDAVVTDCAVDAQAQRTVALRVRPADGPVGVVPAPGDPEVVRALDRLVSRTCRRPRG
jgi:hypothetical protein